MLGTVFHPPFSLLGGCVGSCASVSLELQIKLCGTQFGLPALTWSMEVSRDFLISILWKESLSLNHLSGKFVHPGGWKSWE